MKIYLATFTVKTYIYPDDEMKVNYQRIIIAENEEEAEKFIRDAFEQDEPYSISAYVRNISLAESLGHSL